MAVIPAGAVEIDELVTAEMIEYLEDAPFDTVSAFSDTSGATMTMTTPITDSTIAVNSSCHVSGLGTPSTYYRFMVLLMEKDTSTIILQDYSEMFTNTNMGWTWTYWYLEPETDYSVGFFLVDGSTVVSSVAVAQSFTTPVQGEPISNSFLSSIFSKLNEVVNSQDNLITLLTATLLQDVQANSLLSDILSAINSQNERQEKEYTTILDTLGMIILRLRYIEENTAALAPSEQETALKESTKETTQVVNDALFADDAPTKVTASDVKDVAEIGAAASSMFDSGVSVSSFFDALNNIRFIAFFSQETYDDLNTVQSISTYSRDDESGYVDYYSENLDKIQKFVGGD